MYASRGPDWYNGYSKLQILIHITPGPNTALLHYNNYSFPASVKTFN